MKRLTSNTMKHLMTLIDYTAASIALVVFVGCMFVFFVVEQSR